MKLTIRFEGGSLDGKSATTDSEEYKEVPFSKLPILTHVTDTNIGTIYNIGSECYIVQTLSGVNLNTDAATGEVVLVHK